MKRCTSHGDGHRHRCRATARIAPLLLLAFSLATPLRAQAHAGAGTRAAVARLLLGDAAMMVDARGDGRVALAVNTRDSTLVLGFDFHAVTDWVNESTRLMASAKRPARGKTLTLRATLDEPERDAGGLTLARTIARAGSTYQLFFANRHFGGFTVPVSEHDASILVSALKRAAASARALSDTTPPSARPAAKRPAARS